MLSLPKGLTSVVPFVPVITSSHFVPFSFFLSHGHFLRSAQLLGIFFCALLTRVNTNLKKSPAASTCARFGGFGRSEKKPTFEPLRFFSSLTCCYGCEKQPIAPRPHPPCAAGDVALG